MRTAYHLPVFKPLAPDAPLNSDVLARLKTLVAGGETAFINIHDATHLLAVLVRRDL